MHALHRGEHVYKFNQSYKKIRDWWKLSHYELPSSDKEELQNEKKNDYIDPRELLSPLYEKFHDSPRNRD